MFITNVHVIYNSNYNGCSILTKVGDDFVDLQEVEGTVIVGLANTCIEKIVNYAYDQCDQEDGQFLGDIDSVESFSKQAVQICFGDVDFSFEDDGYST